MRLPVDAVLLAIRPITYELALMPKRCFMLWLNYTIRHAGFEPGFGRIAEHGPFPSRWPIEVLQRANEVTVGNTETSGLGDRLDSAQRKSLDQLLQQNEDQLFRRLSRRDARGRVLGRGHRDDEGAIGSRLPRSIRPAFTC